MASFGDNYGWYEYVESERQREPLGQVFAIKGRNNEKRLLILNLNARLLGMTPNNLRLQ
jgi:hypothetical protein